MMLRAVAAKSVACAVAGNTTTAAAAKAMTLDMAWSVLTRRKRLRHICATICAGMAIWAAGAASGWRADVAAAATPPPAWRPDVAAARRYALSRPGVVAFAVRT